LDAPGDFDPDAVVHQEVAYQMGRVRLVEELHAHLVAAHQVAVDHGGFAGLHAPRVQTDGAGTHQEVPGPYLTLWAFGHHGTSVSRQGRVVEVAPSSLQPNAHAAAVHEGHLGQRGVGSLQCEARELVT